MNSHSRRKGITRLALVLIIVAIVVIGSVAAYYALVLAPSSSSNIPKQINIGAVLALTGYNSAPGQDDKIGMQFWVNHVNSQGGLFLSQYNKKIPVNLILLDDKSDPTQDTSLINQLVDQYNVSGILSGTSFNDAFVIIPQVERLGVPYVSLFDFYNSTWGLYSSIDANPKYVYWVWPNFADLANIFWSWYDAQPAGQRPTSVAAVAASVSGFSTNCQMFLADAKSRGVNVSLPLQTYDVTSTDLTSLVLKLKAANPDVVYAFSLVQDGILLLKEASQLGFHPKLWIMPVTAEFNQLYQSMGQSVNGIAGDTTGNRELPYPNIQELATYYHNQTGGTLGAVSVSTTAVTQVMLDAIQRAGTTNRAAIANALQSTNMVTVNGPVQFNSGHHAYTLVPVIIQWQNNTQKIVWPENLSTSKMQYPGSG